jgi:hypothetical protein
MVSSRAWHLPEGCMWPGFDEWALVMNPDSENESDLGGVK